MLKYVIPDEKAIANYNSLLLGYEGYPKLFKAKELEDIIADLGRNNFIVFCYRNAIYQYPTVELVDWLHQQIGDRSAIELGSGNNLLYQHLGIKGTDSFIQTEKGIQIVYRNIGQRSTFPPEDVENIEAIAALDKYKPQVAIASWLSPERKQWSKDSYPGLRVAYEHLLVKCEKYIMIGNLDVHWDLVERFGMSFIEIEGLVSRAQKPELNVVFFSKKH